MSYSSFVIKRCGPVWVTSGNFRTEKCNGVWKAIGLRTFYWDEENSVFRDSQTNEPHEFVDRIREDVVRIR